MPRSSHRRGAFGVAGLAVLATAGTLTMVSAGAGVLGAAPASSQLALGSGESGWGHAPLVVPGAAAPAPHAVADATPTSSGFVQVGGYDVAAWTAPRVQSPVSGLALPPVTVPLAAPGVGSPVTLPLGPLAAPHLSFTTGHSPATAGHDSTARSRTSRKVAHTAEQADRGQATADRSHAKADRKATRAAAKQQHASARGWRTNRAR